MFSSPWRIQLTTMNAVKLKQCVKPRLYESWNWFGVIFVDWCWSVRIVFNVRDPAPEFWGWDENQISYGHLNL